MMRTILAIDQGTTNSKALLVGEDGRVLAVGAAPLAVSYPQPGWVEQDAAEIWASVCAAVAECLRAAGDLAGGLVAVAVTNQRESTLAWERASGRPLGPVIVWQCRRTAEFCRDLRARGHEGAIHERTGLQVDPLFSASKMRWLLEHIPDGERRARAGDICLGTVDSWLLWNLAGGAAHACDLSNAARTGLLNLHTLSWDPDLLELYGVPAAVLPEPLPSAHVYGETAGGAPCPSGLPVAALVGDSHSALYGHAGFRPGVVKATYGTGTSLMVAVAEPVLSRQGLSTTVAWSLRPGEAVYALEGNISVTGAAVQWLGALLGREAPVGPEEIEALARTVDDAGGVYLVPAFVGLGAPHWREEARGLVTGLTRGSGAAHLARATLEAIAYQVRDVFDALQNEAGAPLAVLHADGGATANDTLMQFQADILGTPLVRGRAAGGVGMDVSALGAAYLAGLAVGIWRDEAEIAALPRPEERLEPAMPAERRQALYAGWRAAVARCVYAP
jgi:glycerol kinase